MSNKQPPPRWLALFSLAVIVMLVHVLTAYELPALDRAVGIGLLMLQVAALASTFWPGRRT